MASPSGIGPIPIPPTPPPFSFQPVNEMFTCGITTVGWTYTGPQATLLLNISNVNVQQDAPPPPPPSSSSVSNIGIPITNGDPAPSSTGGIQPGGAPPRRRQFNGFGGSYLPTVNEVVAEQLDPSVGNWTWESPGVNVPQGWYQMLADVQGTVSSSGPFFVQNGTITSCVQQFAPAVPSSTISSTPAPTSSSTTIGAASSSHHSHAGAIAGGVVGGIAFLAAVLGALLFWLCRRRPARGRGAETGHAGRWTATPLALKKSRHASDAKPSLPKDSVDGNQTFVASDEELSTLGHEKLIAAGAPVFLPYQGQAASQPQSKRTSVQTTTSLARPAERPASFNPYVADALAMERTPTGGGGPRRKPAPRYDAADEPDIAAASPDGASSSRTTLESVHGGAAGVPPIGAPPGHVLQHQSSFGAMRPMHVMMPDPPPPARN
ncbi:hypothetical protein BC834DRAFT_667814 [Gloeopeniophorella convolvens]|nr:hypothetical protein BC834DRAFT_667814 [Gloeopeniophorella convolvens]